MKRSLLSVTLAVLLVLGTVASLAACAPEEVITESGRVDYFESEVLPNVKFDPASYADIQLTLSSDLLVSDEEVMDTIDLLRFEKRSVVNGLTQVTDEPLRMGDDAYIYYRGVIDGKEFEGGSNMDQGTPYELGLGSGAFIPGFEEQLVGVVPSETSKEKPHAVFPERRAAIRYALFEARPGEILLFVGKGHEKYEITAEGKTPFDEAALARTFWEEIRRERLS